MYITATKLGVKTCDLWALNGLQQKVKENENVVVKNNESATSVQHSSFVTAYNEVLSVRWNNMPF